MAKGKFDFLKSVNYGQDEQGRIRMFSDDQRNYFKAENEAKRKIEEANALKQKIADESYAIISQAQKEKAGFERMAAIGKGIDPRNWARGLFNAVTSNVQENIIGGGKAIGEQNAATNLYNQSKDLADQAAKIVKTDRPQAEALLRQSQALTEEANKFAQGEATKKIMGADDKLSGKEIFAKSALTGLELGSFLPVGTVVKGTGVLANVSTKVPATLQASKTVKVGNAITAALGLGDIYQVGKVGAQKGFGAAIQQTVLGQAGKATLQAPVMAGLMEAADDDGVNNYWGSVGTNAIGAFGVTLGLGYGAKVLGSVAQTGVSDISKMAGRTGAKTVTDLAGALPVPKEPAQIGTTQRLMLPEATQATTTIDGKQVGLPTSSFSKLGAFDPQETIPMVDITETIKGNNIDFNPDSVLSINATRKAIDDIALLTGNEVGGKQLKINFEDPKYKEVYNNMIKPLVDRINEVDKPLEFDDFFREYNRMIRKFKDKSFASVDLTFKLDKEIYGGKLELKTQEIEKVWQKWKKTNGENPEEFMQTKTYQSLEKERMDIVREIKNNPKVKKLDLEADKLSEEIDKFKKNYELSKVPVEDVEMEVNKIYSELENAGMNIVPEQVRLTPNIQAVDEKLAKGEIPTPEEFDKGMKEYVNSTGKTEVIDGVQEELRNPMRKSTYVEKLKKENPDLNIESVQYEAAIVKDLEEKAINLIETNFDEAGKIARNITKSSSPEQVKIAELYMEKLRELGKNDELAQILHRFGKASSQAGQWNGILRPNKIGSPEYAIKEAQKTRRDKLKPQIDKEVAKVKQEMSSVVIDQTVIFDILDNITCR